MQERLLALDVFRGMTIFFMIIVNTPGSWDHTYWALSHASWDGLTPTDLVFPFFIFIVGVAMSISFKKFDGSNQRVWIKKILKRTALIFIVGIALNWFPFIDTNIKDLRIFGVLQRIALAYGIGSFVVMFAKDHLLPYIFATLLFGYYVLLLMFGGSEPLSLENNASRMLDLWLVGERHVYGGYGIPFDPEGLLSTIPSIATVLFGYWIGKVIQKQMNVTEKINALIPYAIGATSLGLIWNFIGFPINKPIWSSSFVLVTGGLATITLVLLLFILDEKKWTVWSGIFKAFGLNPLISYVLSGVFIEIFGLIKIQGHGLYSWIYENIFQNIFGQLNGSFIQALVYTLFIWLFAWWMYRKNIVVKL